MESKINREVLLANGYKPFNPGAAKPAGTNGYQKRFQDCNGIQYHITIYEYDRSWDFSTEYLNAYEAEEQFNLKIYNGDKNTFDVLLLGCESKTIDEVEEFFRFVWDDLSCEYYELFDDGKGEKNRE